LKIKNKWCLLLIWFIISPIIAFTATFHISLVNKAEREYVIRSKTVSENQKKSIEFYIKTLEGGFSAIIDFADESEDLADYKKLTDYLTLYCENHKDIEYLRLNDEELYNSNQDIIDIEKTNEIFNFSHEKMIYGFGYKDLPTKQFGLAAKASIHENTVIVIFSKDVVNTIIESVEFPTDLNFTAGNVNTIRIDDDAERIKVARKAAADSLKELVALVIALCLSGIILSIIITKNSGVKHEQEHEKESQSK
jgi:hypothetical protein